MISAEAAALAIAVAKGLIKLAGRIDRLMAEKESVQGPLLIPMPPESGAPDVDVALKLMREYVQRTKDHTPDPLGDDRPRLQTLLGKTPVPDEWIEFFERLFPEKAHPPAIRPDAEYLKALKKWVPSVNWDDPSNAEVRKAAFYITAGRDERGLGYGARLGLLVADTVAEFGAQHTALFVRDPNAQAVLRSVLERFSKPDLETFEDWSPFLRHALSATLNGLLDSSQVLEGHARWADALLEALARARDQAQDPDNYLLGLVRGRGYSLLLGQGLEIAGRTLAAEDAGRFTELVAGLLIEAAPLVKANQKDFGTFFKEHWGDLLRGGLSALARHSPALLEGQSPLMQQTLEAVIRELAAVSETHLFSADTVFHLADAALGAVARNPKLLDGVTGEKWLRELIVTVAGTVHDQGLRSVFSRPGLESVFKEVLATFAKHPELIIAQPGLAKDVVGDVLKAVAQSKGFEALPLAEAAVSAALLGLSKHPELAGTKFGPFVAAVAGLVAKRVADRGLTSVQAADLVTAVVDAQLRNPVLFASQGVNVALAVVQAILKTADDSQAMAGQASMLAGATLNAVADRVLVVVARHGADFVKTQGAGVLTERLAKTLAAGLELASKELGHSLDLESLPEILSGLAGKVLSNELANLDPGSAEFAKAFKDIVDTVHA